MGPRNQRPSKENMLKKFVKHLTPQLFVMAIMGAFWALQKDYELVVIQIVVCLAWAGVMTLFDTTK